jgi:hypothetical protein
VTAGRGNTQQVMKDAPRFTADDRIFPETTPHTVDERQIARRVVCAHSRSQRIKNRTNDSKMQFTLHNNNKNASGGGLCLVRKSPLQTPSDVGSAGVPSKPYEDMQLPRPTTACASHLSINWITDAADFVTYHTAIYEAPFH